MADVAYAESNNPLVTFTAEDLLKFLCFVTGQKLEKLTADEREVFLGAINGQAALWRARHKINHWSESHHDFVWTAGMSRYELPANFGEMKPDSEILQLDPDDDTVLGKIEVYWSDTYDEAYSHLPAILQEGAVHPIEANTLGEVTRTVGIIRGESENYRRFLEIRPLPDTTNGNRKFRVPYYRRINKLFSDSDVLQAPPEVAIGIKFGAAKEIAVARNIDKLGALSQLEEQARQAITSPEARVVKRQNAMTPFEGYHNMERQLRDGQRKIHPKYRDRFG